MRQVIIDINSEPQCLRELRDSGGKYGQLQDECMETVRNELETQQKGRCAYCENIFKSTVFIEHYLPQTKDSDRGLDFGNFLGVCSGKEYSDKMAGLFSSHCNVSKKATIVTYDPRNKEHIESIYYEDDASVRSNKAHINYDLDKTLNLNFDEMRILRDNSYIEILDNMRYVSDNVGLPKEEIFPKVLLAIREHGQAFSGYIEYRIDQLME